MIENIGGIIVYVSDRDIALELYKEKFGFEVRSNLEFQGGRSIEVAPRNSVTTISLVVPSRERMSEEWYNWAKEQIGKETGIWFYTDNIQTSYDELKEKAVVISQPEKQAWGGIMSIVKDQDGNKFALISSSDF
jgi:lactoylglutathione lyase